MILKLKDILSNPFRDITRNPLDEAKVTELVSSITDTGFWDNVVVRKNKAGKYELAYGHHRLRAAIQAGIVEADFIVKTLDDSMMLKIMARENSETYKYSVLALIESVRGVVEALADGRIPAFELAKDVNKQHIRYAPSYTPGVPSGNLPERPYTTIAVARFLGYFDKGNDPSNSVIAALNALELIQKGVLTEQAIQSVNTSQLLTMTRDIKKRVEARSVETKKNQAEVKCVTEQMAKLDADRRAAEQKEKDRQAELRRREIEAHREEDEAEALRLSEEGKRVAAQAAARAVAFKATRAILDAKVKASEERAEQAKRADKDLPTRHLVSTTLYKLQTVVSERNSSREELRSLARNKAMNQAERENVRQALLAVSEWYAEQALAFRPVVQVDVLKEMKQREVAKHKREER